MFTSKPHLGGEHTIKFLSIHKNDPRRELLMYCMFLLSLTIGGNPIYVLK